MENRKGFTLVELLAVITILGIIVTITVVSVSGVINRSTDSGYDTIENQMVEAGKKYVVENIEEFKENKCYDSQLTLTKLIDEGYLKEVKDPANKNNKCNYNDSVVVVKVNNSKYEYFAFLMCGDYETNTTWYDENC